MADEEEVIEVKEWTGHDSGPFFSNLDYISNTMLREQINELHSDNITLKDNMLELENTIITLKNEHIDTINYLTIKCNEYEDRLKSSEFLLQTEHNKCLQIQQESEEIILQLKNHIANQSNIYEVQIQQLNECITKTMTDSSYYTKDMMYITDHEREMKMMNKKFAELEVVRLSILFLIILELLYVICIYI